MALKKHENLTQDEVYRAELMSMRTVVAVILHHALAGHPNPDGAYKEIESAVAQIVAQIPLQAIEPERQKAYRDLVVERASSLMKDAKGIQRRRAKPN